MNLKEKIDELEDIKEDKIFKLFDEYKNDTRENKINLTLGLLLKKNDLYKFDVVKNEEDKCKKHNYLSMNGNNNFIKLHYKLVTGNNYKNELVYQTLSGTGALSLAAKILSYLNYKEIYLPSETWTNHNNVFASESFKIKSYDYIIKPYLDKEKLLNSLSKINNSLILFQSCCHNPTGVDINDDTWDDIMNTIKNKNNIIIIDNAYQGLSSGDLDKDNYCIKKFISNNLNTFICTSHSKNFGLYGQRIGGLIINSININKNKLNALVNDIIRSQYSSPPYYGSLIIENILSNDNKYKLWQNEINNQVKNLKEIRKILYSKLKDNKIYWSCLLNGKGLFYKTDLNNEQILNLKINYGIYILENGRINIAGLNLDNISYFVNSIKQIYKINK